MDPAEEQLQELEVLESIYPDELTQISNTRFHIKINLDTQSDRNHALLLNVKYPEQYPEVIPELSIESIAEEIDLDAVYDSDDDEQTIATKKALNISETIEFDRQDLKILLDKLNDGANDLIGCPMIFSLVTQLKDDAEQLFVDNLNKVESEYNKKRQEQELKDQMKFQGTPVTKESFAKWRAQFRKEMKIDDLLKIRFEKMHNGKLSGKEIFEQGLAGDDDDDELVDKNLLESTKNLVV